VDLREERRVREGMKYLKNPNTLDSMTPERRLFDDTEPKRVAGSKESLPLCRFYQVCVDIQRESIIHQEVKSSAERHRSTHSTAIFHLTRLASVLDTGLQRRV
jgi:hypothetical protein